ncbi:DUF371 domain-containing protein [Saccharopolyspora sp. CA-218241]|uniref:DUF371 domain-containing protein n=1 Tax=Saccharopolyspora sp. CA-218241 TaxID=3240027 RepID=UPI003D957E7A
MAAELLRLRARGHHDVRATHGKTLEFTTDAEITARATCVLGVGTTAAPAHPVAGPVRIEIRCGALSTEFRALAHSGWRPGGTAIVRRSAERLPTTFATDAGLAASALPRDLVELLADPAAEIDVAVRRDTDAAPALIRYHAGPGADPRLTAELAAADEVITADPIAEQAVRDHAPEHRAPAPGRTLVVTGVDPTTPLPADAPEHVELLGVPTDLAVAAAAPTPAPVVLAGAVDRRTLPDLLRTHHAARIVLRTTAAELPKLLNQARRLLGTRTAVLAPTAPGRAERPRRTPVEDAEPGSGALVCCLEPVATATSTAEHPDARWPALLESLLDQDVSPKTLAAALAAQPGWTRRLAYDAVLALKKG